MLSVRVLNAIRARLAHRAILQRSELVVLSPSGHAVFGLRGSAGYNSRWNELQTTRIRARAPIKLRSQLQPSIKSLSLEAGSEQALAHALSSHAYGEYQIR